MLRSSCGRWASLLVLSRAGSVLRLLSVAAVVPFACSASGDEAARGNVDLTASPSHLEPTGAPVGGLSEADTAALNAVPEYPSRDVCPMMAHAPGNVRCFAKIRTDESGSIAAYATPRGLGPSDLMAAYNVPSSGTKAGTIAIVDAYDNPKAESDLAKYRAQYGLPACTTANGCFNKVNQNGDASPLPAADPGWATEIALDLDMASALCPACKILLIEGENPTLRDLGIAVNTAVRMGAAVVSNSYGGGEVGDDVDGGVATIEEADSLYYSSHPGVGIFASSGDNGYAEGTSYPASGANVIGVGGTRLTTSESARGWAEAAWAGAGSGCSTHIAKPPWANDGPDCAKKTVADISAVADPATGVASYNTYGGGGWTVIGGTSAAAPIVAAIFVLAGKAASGGAFIWQNGTLFYDVTAGNNGSGTPDGGVACTSGSDGSYLCNARDGFDGPTGWGTPNAASLLAASGGDPWDGGTPSGDSGGAPSDGGSDGPLVDAARDAETEPPLDASRGDGANDDSGSERIADSATNDGSGCSLAAARSPRENGAQSMRSNGALAAALAVIGALATRRRRSAKKRDRDELNPP